MAYLHSRSQIHRDLKSLNMFVSSDNTLKIGDFGGAINFSSYSRAAIRDTDFFGTTQWCAPECLPLNLPETSDLDHEPHLVTAADVFSYGVVLWEICSGEIPYAEVPLHTPLDFRDLQLEIFRGRRPNMAALHCRSVPQEMVELMQCCWCHAPSQRPCFSDIVRRLAAMDLAILSRQDFEIVEVAEPRERKESVLDVLMSRRRPMSMRAEKSTTAALLASGEYDSDLYSG
eukprot:m.68084 g.68084  ORF g.68084 m.68084 type:complete len:230 (+) comp7480_c1_seq1:3-692(+)